MGNKLRLTVFYGGLATLIFGLGVAKDLVNYDANQDPHVLYSQVKEKADVNHDGNITENEWLKVYNFLEKPYDARHPSSFSVAEMRKYLDLK